MEIAAFTQAGIGVNPPYTGARLSASAFTNVSEPTSHFILSSMFGSAINQSAFYDDAYKELIASTANEPDAAKRKQGYSKINDYLLDQAYCLVISRLPEHPGAGAERARPGLLPGAAVDPAHDLAGLRLRAREAITTPIIAKCRSMRLT